MTRHYVTASGAAPHGRRPRLSRKVAVLCGQIKALAVKQGAGTKLPTSSELCDLFATAPSTLNAVLKELEQQQVIDRRWGVGLFVSPHIGRKGVRVLMDSSLINDGGISPFWGLLMGLCITEAQRRAQAGGADYRFQIVGPNGGGDLVPPDVLEDVQAGHLDGVITIGVHGALPPSVGPDLPLVSYGGDGFWHVGADHHQYVRDGVSALADQGCRRIELWLPTEAASGSVTLDDEYADLFAAETAARGLSGDGSRVRHLGTHHPRAYRGSYQQQGYMLATDVFSKHPSQRPEGLLIMDDMMTAGALFAFGEVGVRPNRDVRVATVANAGSSVLFGHEKSLTLIEISPRELAVALFEMLDTLMAGEVPDREVRFVSPRTRLPFESPGLLYGV